MPKLLSMFETAKSDVVLYHEFHDDRFNWFDPVYRGSWIYLSRLAMPEREG